MTQRDLSEEWARTQLEAWADGSLTGESRARMAAAIAADPRLAAAAERAVAVHRALRASPPARDAARAAPALARDPRPLAACTALVLRCRRSPVPRLRWPSSLLRCG